MKMSYQAVFIVPTGASKVLGEDGWEFNSPERLLEGIGEYLVRYLDLKFEEGYAGINRYSNGRTNMSIFLDDNDKVESVYFQVFESLLAEIYQACQSEEAFSGGRKYLFPRV
ncbi:hypothetical protein [Pseudomonas syringae]|uniref:hypothetical protein n=1 Tax=Pseudomonas syringae TaxID=317 RepID=UPI0013C3589F|nr:hypothetical protein [Pseudomonas syringae]